MKKEPLKEFNSWLEVFRKSRPEQTEVSNAFSALMEVIKAINNEVEVLKANKK